MAVVRGNIGKFPVILASATPSIESHVNALVGRYRHAILPGRFSGVAMPDVSAIDLRSEKLEPGKWLAQRLVASMTETLEKGQQSLLFLNRRGYAPLTSCRSCGTPPRMPAMHRLARRAPLQEAPNLPSLRLLAVASGEMPEVRGAGFARRLRTGRRARAGGSRRTFPRRARRAPVVRPHSRACPRCARSSAASKRASSISSSARRSSPRAITSLASRSSASSTAISGLAHGADPRSAERTFQLLHQVTGRAGRTSFVGRGFVQTYSPDHPVMTAIVAGDRDAFLNYEVKTRQAGPAAALRPLGRDHRLRARQGADRNSRSRHRAARASERSHLGLGPFRSTDRGRTRPAPLAASREGPRDVDLQSYLRAWAGMIPKLKSDVRITVDIDPYNFL